MTRPRITLDLSAQNELELWLNPAGRDLLVQELQRLNTTHDHFHLGPSGETPGVPLETRAYQEGDQIFAWGKVMLRLDEWDEEHFPHVMDGGCYPPPTRAETDPAHVFEPGMDHFTVEFRGDGEARHVVHTFAWDEAGALASAQKVRRLFPPTDALEKEKMLEARIGKVSFETVFADWIPLDEAS